MTLQSIDLLLHLILKYSDYICITLNKFKQVDSIYLNFSEAFDSINQNLIIIIKIIKIWHELIN